MSTERPVKKQRSKKVAVDSAVLIVEGKQRLPPVRHGLTVVACLSTEGRRLTRETLIRAALNGGDELPIPMPKKKQSLFSLQVRVAIRT